MDVTERKEHENLALSLRGEISFEGASEAPEDRAAKNPTKREKAFAGNLCVCVCVVRVLTCVRACVCVCCHVPPVMLPDYFSLCACGIIIKTQADGYSR